MAPVLMKFAAADERIRTLVGQKVGSVISLRSEPGFGLFGPYVDLPAGACVARIFFDGDTRGHVTVDILARGHLVLASRAVDLGTLDGRPLEIAANLAQPQSACEVRINCVSGAHADVSAVEIEVRPSLDAAPKTDLCLEEKVRFLFEAMLSRPPSEAELAFFLSEVRDDPAEAVSRLCLLPEFVMKHPSFTPKPMAESLVKANVNGVDMLVPTNDWVHWGTAQGWGYEKWVADAMRRILKPGSVFVDIGANTGVLTMLGAALVGDTGQVYAIEASIENAGLILLNLRNSEITNTVILPIAVSDKKGIELISVDYGGTNKSMRTEALASKNYRFEPVATDTLDSLLSHVIRVDLIKIDIEGHEGSACRGGWDLLARTRPQIIGEYHSGSPQPWYADELVAKGYSMEVLTREGGIIALGRDIGRLRETAAQQLAEHGTCLEILFSP